MAATEYYMGTAAAQQMQDQQRLSSSNELPGQHQFTNQYSQPPNQLQAYTDKPSGYSPYPTQQPPPPRQQAKPPQNYQPQQYQQSPQDYPPQQQQQPYFPPPPTSYSSHPSTLQMRPQGYQPQPPRPQQQNGYLGVRLQKQRSHSQPAAPHVHFADHDEYDTDSGRSYASEDSSPRRRDRRKHHHQHSSSRDYDSSRLRSKHEKSHKDRDTFLAAGAGGVIGDAIFPGLGTVGGLLLGGYGGRKHASKKERSRSDTGNRYGDKYGDRYEERRERYPADYRSDYVNEHSFRKHRDSGYGGEYDGKRDGGSGWDEESATYKKGWAVR